MRADTRFAEPGRVEEFHEQVVHRPLRQRPPVTVEDEPIAVRVYNPVPAGGGAVFEAVFEKGESGEGVYAFVTHAFADASKGAVGLIKVGNKALAAGMGH